MSTPRRRLVRPAPAATPTRNDHQLRVNKPRSRLEGERASLERWMKRLKRSFHAVEKSQLCLSRLERQIARLEQ